MAVDANEERDARAGDVARWEEELEKVRGDGDLVLIKVQAERHKVSDAEARLRALKLELKEVRKATNKPGALLVSCADAPEDRQHSHTPERQIHLEERLKVAVSERAVELQRLRTSIDELRRQQLDAHASTNAMEQERMQIEEEIRRSQQEAEALKQTAALLRGEILQLEQEFDIEKHAFRIEKQRLLEEVDCASRLESSLFAGSPPSHKGNVYNNIGKRKSYNRMSRARQMSLEQKIVSFEQKKAVLDRIVEETSAENIGDFIQQFLTQERAKAEAFARIEAKSAANLSLRDSIAQLADDITRLSGMGDVRSIMHLEQPSELQKVIAEDENQISQLKEDGRVFVEALKTLREPIRDLHHELFPNQSADSTGDPTSYDIHSLRKLGEIEERTMQLVLLKVLREVESPVSSDTLARLRQYQGFQHQHQQTMPILAITTGIAPGDQVTAVLPQTKLNVIAPSVERDGRHNFLDENDDSEFEEIASGLVVRSDDYRRKIAASFGSPTSNASGIALSINAAAGATPSSPTRKNATIALL